MFFSLSALSGSTNSGVIQVYAWPTVGLGVGLKEQDPKVFPCDGFGEGFLTSRNLCFGKDLGCRMSVGFRNRSLGLRTRASRRIHFALFSAGSWFSDREALSMDFPYVPSSFLGCR